MTLPTDLRGARFDFILPVGFDTDFTAVWADSTGTPIDITGYTAKLALKPGIANAAAITLTTSALTGSRLSIPVGTDGKIYIHFDHADTLTVPAPKNYNYDLRLYNGTGVSQKQVIWGVASAEPWVTPSV